MKILSTVKGKVIILLTGLLAVAFPAGATPVSKDDAALAVKTWLGWKLNLGCRLGAKVAEARTCTPTNSVSFHVVKLDGGGFVVTSSDTEVEPIIAFSESDDLIESEKNPLWTMLRRDLAARTARRRKVQMASSAGTNGVAVSSAAAKWARLLPSVPSNGIFRLAHASSGLTTLSDIRVSPLVKSRWNQMQDAYYSNRGSPCYNYYTPSNYPCGCVATAAAQIMRYHRHPAAAVTPGTYACGVEIGKDWIDDYSYHPIYENLSLTMQGGVYDWDSMPFVPADGTTPAQRQAIGKLTSDVGIACLMYYGDGGSSAAIYMLARCLPERFGYASAVAACNSGGLDSGFVRKVLVSNLDAKLPVALGLDGYYGGHAVVVDGYGYSDSTFYAHFNLGWAGTDDAWYAPPDVADEYYAVDTMVYNINPSGPANGVIVSGRILSPSGLPVPGIKVDIAGGETSMSTRSDENGIYSFTVAPGDYTLSSRGNVRSVTLIANVGTTVLDSGSYYVGKVAVNNLCDCDIKVDVEPGEEVDCVLVCFSANGGSGSMDSMKCSLRKVYALKKCAFEPPAGKSRFAGWLGPDGRRYDDGVLVFDLAKAGETVTMTAIWE